MIFAVSGLLIVSAILYAYRKGYDDGLQQGVDIGFNRAWDQQRTDDYR